MDEAASYSYSVERKRERERDSETDTLFDKFSPLGREMTETGDYVQRGRWGWGWDGMPTHPASLHSEYPFPHDDDGRGRERCRAGTEGEAMH